MNYPIFIPSKGRAKTAKIEFCSGCFIEPQDFNDYAARWPNTNFYVLPESDQGVSYARNSILELAKSMGVEWYWSLDDDLTRWWRATDGKPQELKIWEALEEAEQYTVFNNLGIISIGMGRQYFSVKPALLNSTLTAASLINVRFASECSYRLPVGEDHDFTLQMLMQKHCTLRLRHLAFDTPPMGAANSQIKWLDDPETRNGTNLLQYWNPSCFKEKIRKSNNESYIVINPKAFLDIPVHYGEIGLDPNNIITKQLLGRTQ